MTKNPRILWQISGGCDYECWYCPAKNRNNPTYKTLDEYLTVVDKLQNYGDRKNIPKLSWKFKGGEPLHFTNFNILLRNVKAKTSYVTVETSGGQTWFDLYSVVDYIDNLILTHHYWQEQTVLDFLIDVAADKEKEIKIFVPMLPGVIKETRAKMLPYIEAGLSITEQLMTNSTGGPHEKYTMKDLNIFYGRPEDWVPPPAEPTPVWVDPRIQNGSPVYTGKQCWAGVDYLYIDSKGFPKGSECGGRDMKNVFDPDWTPEFTSFACPMMFCHHDFDRNNIRIEV